MRSTILLGVEIPEYPNDGQEICHCFTGNFITHSQYFHLQYDLVQVGTNTPMFISNIIQNYHYRLIANNNQINSGDIILIYNRNVLVHSMVAVNQDIWFGVNNLTTFGTAYVEHGIPTDTLCCRREIDMRLCNNYNAMARTFSIGGIVNPTHYTFKVYRKP